MLVTRTDKSYIKVKTSELIKTMVQEIIKLSIRDSSRRRIIMITLSAASSHFLVSIVASYKKIPIKLVVEVYITLL